MSIRRRDFLKAAVGTPALLSLAPAVPAFLSRAAHAADGAHADRNSVLVVLQLSGGNDSLNTVVPVGDDQYGRQRFTLRLTPQEVLKIDDHSGFHPSLEGVARLFNEGKLNVIQGVGYERSSRDHDGAMRDWHTARPGDNGCETGWMGRAIDAVDRGDQADVPGVFVGPIPTPMGMTAARRVVPHVRTLEQLTLRGAAADELDPLSPPADNPLADFVSRTWQTARAGSRRVQDVLRAAGAAGPYPDFPLAGQLKMIAQLIRAELGIRIFFTELGGGGIGGFDNHANQRDNHAALLSQFSQAVTAFVDDLTRAGLDDRVVLMTFSEFGRSLKENGRRGTDHGAAAATFLAGTPVRGGLTGPHPDLTDLDQGAPKSQIDFRRLYATLLDRWLGFDSQSVLGARFQSLDLLT